MISPERKAIIISFLSFVVAVASLSWNISDSYFDNIEDIIVRDVTKFHFKEDDSIFSVTNNGRKDTSIRKINLISGYKTSSTLTRELELPDNKYKIEAGEGIEIQLSYIDKINQIMSPMGIAHPAVLEVETYRGNKFTSPDISKKFNFKLTEKEFKYYFKQ